MRRRNPRHDPPQRPSDELPAKFTTSERRAYDWLYEAGVRPWFVDLVDKHVTAPSGKFSGLVEYAVDRGMEKVTQS